MKIITGLAFAVLACAPASAANLIVENDKLVGAKNVLVSGVFYDVEFVEGSCISLFNGCSESTVFTFDSAGASAAAEALLDQVFVDGAKGNFDSDPTLTFGCTNASSCASLVPFQSLLSHAQIHIAVNRSASGDDFVDFTSLLINFDTTRSLSSNYAKFTLSAVPEPATWAMMIGGFGLVGAAARRRVATTVRYA